MWGIQTDWVPTCLVPIESQFFLSVPGLREVKSDHQLSLVSSPSASAGMMAQRHGKQATERALPGQPPRLRIAHPQRDTPQTGGNPPCGGPRPSSAPAFVCARDLKSTEEKAVGAART